MAGPHNIRDNAFEAFNEMYSTWESALVACMNYFKSELARRDAEILRLTEKLGRAKSEKEQG